MGSTGVELTSDEIDQMREEFEAVSFPDTCNLLTKTVTRDSEGGVIDTWGTATADVDCLLEDVSRLSFREELVFGASLRGYSSWLLQVAHDVSVTGEMKVEVGDATFNVVSVVDNPSWKLTTGAVLEKVE